MVKTRRKDYEAKYTESGEKRTKTEMEATTRSMGGMTGTPETIPTKTLQEIIAESNRYESPPRPVAPMATATVSATYQRTPVTHKFVSQPRFPTPLTRYPHTGGNAGTTVVVTTATDTPIPTPIKTETTKGDSFDIEDGMVTISYTRTTANPNHWEPVKITLNEFKERYVDTIKETKKRVTFVDDIKERKVTEKVKFTTEEEELMRKIEDWAAKNKRLPDDNKPEEDDEDSDREKKRYDKTVMERKLATTTATGDGMTTMYENRLAFVRNIPKLPEKEHLTGANNYDGWSTKMRMFFTAFDVTEYLEKPLNEILETEKVRQQLDAATLLAIHGNISSALQQVVNNEVHAFEAWETLRKLYTGSTIQELVNIGSKMVELNFSLATPVTSFFAEVEANFLKLHRMGFTVSEKVKCAYVLMKIYPKLPATAASITSLPDEQVTVRFLQEKVIKAAQLISRNTGELGETGDPRPGSSGWSTKTATPQGRGMAYTMGRGNDRRAYRSEMAGVGRGMTMADGEDGSYVLSNKKCLRCFATNHDAEQCPKPDMRRCYTCNLTGHISKNCHQYKTQGKAINTIIKNCYNLRPILDTGAAVSLVPDVKLLKYPTRVTSNETIKLTDGTNLPLGYRGTLNLRWENGDRLTLNDVYTAPGINEIIISAVNLIKRQGMICNINKNCTYLYSERQRREDGNGYELEHDGEIVRFKRCEVEYATTEASRDEPADETTQEITDANTYGDEKSDCKITRNLSTVHNNNKIIKANECRNSRRTNTEAERKNAIIWHRRLGHINYRKLGVAHKTVEGIGTVTAPNVVCEVCAEAKATRKSYKQVRTRSDKPGYRTHADLIGPITPATYMQGGRYILTLVDDHSRYATTYILRNKKETVEKLRNYFTYVKTLFPQQGRLAALRTDAGTEFTNTKVKRLLDELGIRLELAETDIHEHNGTAERYNRTHQNKIRALLFDAGFPNTFWGWASDAATYLYNRVPHTANNDVTPFEKFFGKRPNIKNIRVFGTLAHTLLPRTKRLDKRTGKRYIIGFTDTGYIVYNPTNGKTERTCNLRTDELRNYGDEAGSRWDRHTGKIAFEANNTGDDNSSCGQSENNNTTVSEGNKNIDGGCAKHDENFGATIDKHGATGNATGHETVYESVTLDSRITLPNSQENCIKNENNETKRTNATEKSGITNQRHDGVRAVIVRNEESDSDMSDGENESIYSIELDSKVSIGDETNKPLELTEWEPSKIAGVNQFEPAATSTQYVNAIKRIQGVTVKTKNDGAQRTIPKNYTQATTDELGDIWRPAIEKEMNAMAEHYVWDIIERPKNCKPLPCAWKFSYKDDGTAKARLYLVGNREPIDSLQNTYAPVTDMMTVLWLCSLAVKYGVPVYQMDVTTAFLNAELDTPRYMRLPDGLTLDKTKYVCRLNKAIYGLRISPRRWYLKIEQDLTRLGLRQSVHEPCLFYVTNGDRFVILTVYVDDLLITGTDTEKIDWLKQEIKKTYEIKDLGEIKRFLGMDVNRKDKGEIQINQTEYIKEIVRAANLTEANTKPTPMAKFGNFPTVKDNDYLPNVTEYKSILGKLQFLATHTRPDIAHSVNYCARYQAAPEKIHYKLVQRIIRYLKGTAELSLRIAARGTGIAGYADADHQQCPETRKSTTGYIVKFNGDTVAWKSTRQRSRGNSTTDSELIAVNACARRCKGLANMYYEIFPNLKAPFRLYQDNTSTIKRTGDATTLGQYKEIDAKDKYVVQLIKNGEATVMYLPTAEHFADPLTKPLDTAAFDRHRRYIMESIEDLKETARRVITEKENLATENRRKYFELEQIWESADGEFYQRKKNTDNNIPAPTGGGC